MSGKGIYTALTGAIAQSKRLDTIANNIANANTTGFKANKQVFNEYLTDLEKTDNSIQFHQFPASEESFYDIRAYDRSYVDANSTYTNIEQGALQNTNNPLDLGLEGKGFMEILTSAGVRYTRNGALKRDVDGFLVTKDGHYVLQQQDEEALPPDQRKIQVGDKGVTVSYMGEVFSDGVARGKISMFEAGNFDALAKEGANRFRIKKDMDPLLTRATNTETHQGYIERSNVNIVDEMTNMISATRVFESTQDIIKAFDQINGKLVNDVPKV